MMFSKLVFLLPSALSAGAVPTTIDNPARPLDFPSFAGAGSPPPPGSRPPSTLDLGDALNVDASMACYGPQGYYGGGKWTYVEAQWCLTNVGNTTEVSQQLSDPWYYWGGAWYKGDNYKLSWHMSGTVSISGGGSPNQFSHSAVSDNTGVSTLAVMNPKLDPGAYDLVLDLNLQGPYWTDDGTAINTHVTASGLNLG